MTLFTYLNKKQMKATNIQPVPPAKKMQITPEVYWDIPEVSRDDIFTLINVIMPAHSG